MVDPERAAFSDEASDGRQTRVDDTGQPDSWPRHTPGADRSPRPHNKAHDAFRAVLTSVGMCGALGFLNARTRYRFTGIYRADPPVLRNVYLFDRENPSLSLGGDVVPLDNTYCGIVAATSTPFLAVDATMDPRLSAHPARDSVVSYAGVPVRSADGRIFGTLCHFDLRPRILPLDELAVLEASSRCISDWLTDTHASWV